MSDRYEQIICNESGIRVDVYLTKYFSNFSRGYFQRLIKKGLVTINDRCINSHYKVKLGDRINCRLINENNLEIIPENIPLDILWEDKDLIVINKPAGIVVHPSCGHSSGTLLNALKAYAKDNFIPFLVHRLDKDTSGVILIAKNERTKVSFVKQFQNRTIKKVYLAFVKGCISQQYGRIEAPLGRSPYDRKKIVVGPLAKKNAITEFKVLKSTPEFSLIEVYPITGRTHQIRSHLAYIGHPVLGDKTYSAPVSVKGYIIHRQMLHAYRISFRHPSNNKMLEFTAPLPSDFNKFLNEFDLKII